MVNVSIVWGECTASPEVRELESGSRVAAFPLRVRSGEAAATSVPITVWEPAGWVEELAAGDQVVVVGRVRRRFFRSSAGGVGASVDVEAGYVARAHDTRSMATARRRALVALEPLLA